MGGRWPRYSLLLVPPAFLTGRWAGGGNPNRSRQRRRQTVRFAGFVGTGQNKPKQLCASSRPVLGAPQIALPIAPDPGRLSRPSNIQHRRKGPGAVGRRWPLPALVVCVSGPVHALGLRLRPDLHPLGESPHRLLLSHAVGFASSSRRLSVRAVTKLPSVFNCGWHLCLVLHIHPTRQRRGHTLCRLCLPPRLS